MNLLERICENVSNRVLNLSDFEIAQNDRFSFKLEFVCEDAAKMAEDELRNFKSFCEGSVRLGSAIALYNIYNVDNCVNFSTPYLCYTSSLNDFDEAVVNERFRQH